MNKQLIIVVGVIEHEGKILITRRNSPNNTEWHQRWELPGGKIQPGETPLEAFYREIFEETQLHVKSPELLGIHTHHWKLTDYTQQTFIVVYKASATHAEVRLNPRENDRFEWTTVEDILSRDDLLAGTHEIFTNLVSQSKQECKLV